MNRRSIVALAAALLGLAALQAFAADDYYITTVAGTGKRGYSGDGGPATQAMFNLSDFGLYVSDTGIIYVPEARTDRVRRIDRSGVVTTIAGNGVRGFSGDGGPATKASLRFPVGVALDSAGNLYIVDNENFRIRKVDTAGIITTVAGTGKQGYSGDGGPAANAEFWNPAGLLIDGAGNIYISDYTPCCVIRKIDTSGIISTIAGTGKSGYSGDGGPAIKAALHDPLGMAFDPQGNLYFTEFRGNAIRKIDTSGIITTVVAGGLEENDGPASKASLQPAGIAVDPDGNLIVASTFRNKVHLIDEAGMVTTIAGTGIAGYSGDGWIASVAELSGPYSLYLAADGSIYFTEYGNATVRKLYRP